MSTNGIRKLFLLGLPIAVSLSMTACSSARIIPKANGDYVVIGTSYSESDAYDVALEKARGHCKEMGKRFGMIAQRSKYSGMDKTAKGIVDTVAVMHGTAAHTSSEDDYKVEMHFRCQ